MKKKAAVFLDRDGTINIDFAYIKSPSNFVFIKKSKEAIKRLKEHDFSVIVVSNQSGVGRGFFTERELEQVNNYLVDELAKEDIYLDGIYYCPHTPEENCECRKPSPKMIELAASKHKLDLKFSYFVGDKLTDVETGKQAGCRTILITEDIAKLKFEAQEAWIEPDYVAKDLYEAVEWIIKNQT